MKIYLDVSCLNRPFDDQRQPRILSMLPPKSDILPLNDLLFHRAQELQQYGIKPADALHVAAAESHQADVFLTCDDRLLKAARRNKRLLGIRVDNPVTWIETDEQR
jgi:predicted nucleic acid-binding protein